MKRIAGSSGRLAGRISPPSAQRTASLSLWPAARRTDPVGRLYGSSVLGVLCALCGSAVGAAGAEHRVKLENAGFEEGALGGIAGWKVSHCREGRFEPGTVIEERFSGKRSLGIRLEPGRLYVSSIWQKLPETNPNLVVTFSLHYKADGRVPMHIDLSSGPVCRMPWARYHFAAEADGKWHRIANSFLIREFKSNEIYAEILIEGKVDEPTSLYLDEIKIATAEPKSALVLLSPQSGVLFDRLESNDLLFASTYKARREDLRAELFFGDTARGQRLGIVRKDPFLFSVGLPRDLPIGTCRVRIRDVFNNVEVRFPLEKMRLREPYCVIYDGVPYVNGKPFLAVGIYHTSDVVLRIVNAENRKAGLPEITRREMLRSVADRGFNLVVHGWRMGPKDYFEDAEKNGLMVIPETICTARERAGRDYRNLFAWYAMDEPTVRHIDRLEGDYRTSRRNDPFHPVYTALAGDLSGLASMAFCDIPAPDEYPIGGPNSNLTSSLHRVAQTRRFLVRNDTRRCCFFVPQLFTASGGRWRGFEPTFAQVRCETYLGVIGGAKGFVYYSYYTHEKLLTGMPLNPRRKYWFLPESNLWDRIGELNRELAALKEVILFGEDSDLVAVTGRAECAVRTVSGRTYILIANPAAAETKVSFQYRNARPGFTPLFDSPRLPSTGKSLSLGKYQVAVWRSRSGKDGAQ